MDTGDEWKYEARGEELTQGLVARLVLQKARALVWCSKLNEDFPIEMLFVEASPDKDYVRLQNQQASWLGCSPSCWVASDAIRFICVLPKQEPRQVIFEKVP